jgi:hypothetical protein
MGDGASHAARDYQDYMHQQAAEHPLYKFFETILKLKLCSWDDKVRVFNKLYDFGDHDLPKR